MNLTDDDLAVRELRDAVATGRPETIAHAAMANVWPLYSSHVDELLPIVEALPSSVLERYPVLRILHRMTPVLARNARPFKPLVHPDDARTMTSDELDILTLVQIIGFRFSGDVAAALIYARRLDARITQTHSASRERADGPLWYYHQQIGSTLLAAGLTSEAMRQFSISRQLGQLSQQTDAERMALSRNALAHAVRGGLDDAERALAEAHAHAPPAPPHASAILLTEQTTRALIDVERMEPGAADLVARLEPYDSIQLTWPFALLARTRFLIAHHRADEALEAIRLASDAHPDQHGSFASDVITSASIDALWAAGATTAAFRLVESVGRPGQLTRVAIIRHALLESRFDVAERGMRRASTDHLLGPGQRAELVLLSAWLHSAETDAIDPQEARHVARLTQSRGLRRVLATLPLRVIEHVREGLSDAEAAEFERAMHGISSTDRPPNPRLTPRELRVLNSLSAIATTADIASSLHVSPNTIKTQLRSVYRKLGCSTREDAIMIASRLHLLAVESEAT